MPSPSVRGKLIEGALQTFHARGFNGCSVQDIVDAAGVPKGSFYNHFKTKESLALKAIALYEAGNGAEILEDETRAPLARVRAHFEFLASRLEKLDYRRGCLLGTLSAELSDTKENEELRDALAGALKSWSRGDRRGALGAGTGHRRASSAKRDPARLSRFLLNSWQGAVARSKLSRAGKPLAEFFAVAFEELLV